MKAADVKSRCVVEGEEVSVWLRWGDNEWRVAVMRETSFRVDKRAPLL